MTLTRLGYEELARLLNDHLEVVRMCPVCGFIVIQKMTAKVKAHIASTSLKAHSNIPIEACPFHPDAKLMEGYIDRK